MPVLIGAMGARKTGVPLTACNFALCRDLCRDYVGRTISKYQER